MMRFSEAIKLGSTLIGESDCCFYYSEKNHGCAHGAAWAAIGALKAGPVGHEYSERFFPICALLPSKAECCILTGDPANLRFRRYFRKGAARVCTLGMIVSAAHNTDRLPRLELARRIRIVEDMHPEIPGSSQGSRGSHEEAAMARAG